MTQRADISNAVSTVLASILDSTIARSGWRRTVHISYWLPEWLYWMPTSGELAEPVGLYRALCRNTSLTLRQVVESVLRLASTT